MPPSPRYEPLPLVPDPELERRVRARLGQEVDSYGVLVKNLADGRGLAINAEQVFNAASLYKLEVLYEVFKQQALGLVDFKERLPITPRYVEFDLDTLKWGEGCQVPVGLLVEAMITYSDNASAMMLYDRAGGWNIDRDMKAIGLRNSQILSVDLTTTAADMALLLEMIALGKAVDAATSQAMVEVLLRQQLNYALPALLPPGTGVAHKTGRWENAGHDVGIVYGPKGAYVIAVLSDDPNSMRTIAELSRLVYDYFAGTP